MRAQNKIRLQQLRRWRIRNKISGTAERPRMSVCFSNQNIYVQFIDDAKGRTVAWASTVAKDLADRAKLRANVTSAKRVGTLAAQAAISKGITAVVFDRSGARFHGKVKALADAAREAGLKF